ncbi:sugar phosphate isomerase/epimerase [Terrarubrum flagellatum]|uniref:sugar phosphate isomerase/epimerase family protein n=1 Tax=Terrirubrum flagellatum TaxID=2895980 RepID=UPI003144D789
MKPIDRLSFQLYSARSLESLEKSFELLAPLGYKLVEPYGGLFSEPDKLKALLDKYEMKAPTAHVGLDRLRADATSTVAICKNIGIETIFAPAPPMGEREGDEAHWRKIGKELAAIGKLVADEGLKFGWHNHHWEFAKTSGGRTYLDAMFEEAPEISWEADLAWIIRGGGDPVAELAKYKGRVIACHIKDIAPAGECVDEDGWADPGHGVMGWPALLAAMKDAGVSFFVAEHDKPNNVSRFARRARQTISSWS